VKNWLDYLRDPNPWTPPDPLPSPIVTDRLVIRLYQAGDGPGLFKAVDSERSTLFPYMAWARTEQRSLDDSIFFIESCRRDVFKPDATQFFMGIFDKTSGLQIGGSGFSDVQAGLSTAEVGYWIRGSWRRQGHCMEALRALLSAAFRTVREGGWGFRRIVINCAAGNVPSRSVCERLGLRLEVNARQSKYLGPAGSDGAPGYLDMLGFAVLADEWDIGTQALRPPGPPAMARRA
jgi:ribosomal-protein-serine acetyltransferase